MNVHLCLNFPLYVGNIYTTDNIKNDRVNIFANHKVLMISGKTIAKGCIASLTKVKQNQLIVVNIYRVCLPINIYG